MQYEIFTNEKSKILILPSNGGLDGYMPILNSTYRVEIEPDFEKAVNTILEQEPAYILFELSSNIDVNLNRLRDISFARNRVLILSVMDEHTADIASLSIELGYQDSIRIEDINENILIRLIDSEIKHCKLINTINDMSGRIQESDIRFNDIAERIHDGLWIRSAETMKCLYLNSAFVDIWERNIEEMNSISWMDTIHPDDKEWTYKEFQKYQSDNEDYVLHYRIVTPSGKIKLIENRAYSVLNPNGELIRMAGIAKDITAQKKMETDLRLAQKLESIGQLSAGIAHEINTPSQYVSDNISFISNSFSDFVEYYDEVKKILANKTIKALSLDEIESFEKFSDELDIEYLIEELPKAIEQSQSGMMQIKKIVLAMKNFSHQREEKSRENINDAINNAIMVAKNEWKYVAEVSTVFDNSIPLVFCNISSLNQVFLNMIINAAHAITEKYSEAETGNISVSTSKIENNVSIKIKDDGEGIAKDAMENIFDPFFTTKEVGKGTGQGLAIAERIVREEHKGSISVSSEKGVGTCFTILIPINADNEKGLK